MKWQDEPENNAITTLYLLETGDKNLDYLYRNYFRIYLAQDEDDNNNYILNLFGKQIGNWFEEDFSLKEIKVKALLKLHDEILTSISLLQKFSTAFQMDNIQERICREGTHSSKKESQSSPSLPDYYPLLVTTPSFEFDIPKGIPPVIWGSAEKSES